jgi:hypothetical protein
MYCSLEEAWNEPWMVPTPDGFQFRSEWDTPVSRQTNATSSHAVPEEHYDRSTAHLEGFQGAYNPPVASIGWQQMHEELRLLRRDMWAMQSDMKQRMDFLCILVGALVLIVVLDRLQKR